MLTKVISVRNFSSDMNGESLLVSDYNGQLMVLGSNKSCGVIESTKMLKFVKFFPADHFVFTTTDQTGLAVYDTFNRREIYKYKNENLNAHAYSNKRIIATSDEYNLKFYDLKCRYLIHSIQNSGGRFNPVNSIDWIDDNIIIHDGSSLKIYDFRNGKISNHFENVTDFTVCNKICYFVKQEERDKYELIRLAMNNTFTTKKFQYNKLESLNDVFVLGMNDNRLRIENENKMFNLKFDFNIRKIFFVSNGTWILGENDIFHTEVSVDSLVSEYLEP